jgi:hypothetical protein
MLWSINWASYLAGCIPEPGLQGFNVRHGLQIDSIEVHNELEMEESRDARLLHHKKPRVIYSGTPICAARSSRQSTKLHSFSIGKAQRNASPKKKNLCKDIDRNQIQTRRRIRWDLNPYGVGPSSRKIGPNQETIGKQVGQALHCPV